MFLGLQVSDWLALGVKVTIVSLLSYYASNYMLEMLDPRDRKKMENVSTTSRTVLRLCKLVRGATRRRIQSLAILSGEQFVDSPGQAIAAVGRHK